MNALLAQVLPFAIAAAISPTVLTIVLLILAGAHKPLIRAWAFTLGGVAFTILFVWLSVTIFGNLGDAGTGHQSMGSRIVKLVFAAVLLALAVRQVIRARHPKPAAGGPNKWQRRLANARTIDFVAVGFMAMLSNASTLVMILAGAHVVTVSQAPDSAKVEAAIMLGVFAALPMLLPVLGVTAFGSHADGALKALNKFTTDSTGHYNVLRQTEGGQPKIQARTLITNLAFCYWTQAGDPNATSCAGSLPVPLSVTSAGLVRLITTTTTYDAITTTGTKSRQVSFSSRLRNVA